MLYSFRAVCTATFVIDTNQEQRLRLPQNTVDVEPVTKKTHLDRRRRIIPPITTGKTPGYLSRTMMQNAIITCMDAQGEVIVVWTLFPAVYLHTKVF